MRIVKGPCFINFDPDPLILCESGRTSTYKSFALCDENPSYNKT